MVRRKAAQKSGRHTARKFVHAPKFPADRLPAELIHMIFTYLEPTEVATFRWAGKVVGEIGLQYLAPTVYLKLNEESYDRLLAIAEHPVVSKYVVKLDYETEGLESINRELFDRMIRRSTRLLNRAWSMYAEYQASQKKVQNANFFREKTAEAIRRFGNLKRISTSTHGALERYVAEIKAFLPTYYFPRYMAYGDPSNVGATSYVLLAAESARLRVENFCCHSVNWQIFTQDKQNLAALKRSLLHLKTMDIAFTVRPDILQDRIVEELEFIFEGCLGKGHVADLITSAPDLEYLGLTFNSSAQCTICPRIDANIGNFYWPSLKAFSLDSLATSEDELVDFCKRHAHTLEHCSLRNMQLDEGFWASLVHRMRRAFRFGQQLDTCELARFYYGHGGIIHPMHPTSGDDVDAAGIVASNYIQATNVGDISFGEYYEAMGLM